MGRLLSKATCDVCIYPDIDLLGYARWGCNVFDVEPMFFVHVSGGDAQALPAANR